MGDVKKATLIDEGSGVAAPKGRRLRLPIVIAGSVAAGMLLAFAITGVVGVAYPAYKNQAKNGANGPEATPDDQVAINGQNVFNDYFDNAYTAGQKYDGKKIKLTVTILQTKMVKGRMQLWYCGNTSGVLPLIVFNTKADPGPGATTIKPYEMATIEGICQGRIDDGRSRANMPGWTFYINVTDCTVCTRSRPQSRCSL